jgi:NifU-like protein involved in Fe-S cluster formation
MKYPPQLLHYFHHRAHAGFIDPVLPGFCQSQVGSAENRDVLTLTVEYRQRIIVQAKFQAGGSIALIAAGEFICGWLEQKSWQDLQLLTAEWVLENLGLAKTYLHIGHLIVIAVNKLQDIIACQFSAQ